MLKLNLSKTELIFLLLLIPLLTMGLECEGFTFQYPISLPQDRCPSYDTDCDDISNAVELNSANSYLNLDTSQHDPNPSIAHGWPCNGWIENALNMVNTGTGYFHYNPEKKDVDHDDWGVLHLINMIEGAGREWYINNYIPPRIGVGDLSWGDTSTLQFGGPWPGGDHICHQNGLEVDIRYVRNDGLEIGLNISSPDSIYYNRAATSFLMNRLIEHGNVDLILYDSVHAHIIGGPLVHDSSHSDHFHVRIQDPDGTNN